MIVKQVSVGTPVMKAWEGREIHTAFFKSPVEGPVYLGPQGFTGDTQVYEEHGGSDRAALLYAAEHYAYWAEFLGRPVGPTFLGENLTVEGLTEATACIGDVLRIGTATVQVCQPRVPCGKVNVAHDTRAMLPQVIATGFTGFFVRVLTPGLVAAGDRLELLTRPTDAPTVARVNQVLYHEKGNRAAKEQLLQAEGLAAEICQMLQRQLA